MACTFLDGAEFIPGSKAQVWICDPVRIKAGKVCSSPNCADPAPLLCDYATTKGTCDRSLCRAHATRGGAGIDYCRVHAGMLAEVAR